MQDSAQLSPTEQTVTQPLGLGPAGQLGLGGLVVTRVAGVCPCQGGPCPQKVCQPGPTPKHSKLPGSRDLTPPSRHTQLGPRFGRQVPFIHRKAGPQGTGRGWGGLCHSLPWPFPLGGPAQPGLEGPCQEPRAQQHHRRVCGPGSPAQGVGVCECRDPECPAQLGMQPQGQPVSHEGPAGAAAAPSGPSGAPFCR